MASILYISEVNGLEQYFRALLEMALPRKKCETRNNAEDAYVASTVRHLDGLRL